MPVPTSPRTPTVGSADDPWAVAERRSRAVEEPLDVVLLVREPFPLLEVRNPLHRTDYRVMLPGFPDRTVTLCTCSDFARRGLGTCKHIEAAGRWLERRPSVVATSPGPVPDSDSVWAEIDRRLDTPRPPTAPDSRTWRTAGATLFERAVPPYALEKGKKEEVGRGDRGRSRPSPSRARP